MRKSMRVLITDKCNMNCATCFNKSLRKNTEMPVETFNDLCSYLKNEGGIRRLKIMGGEPTIHPYFLDIVEIAKNNFESIHIFTNASTDIIKSLCLRPKDTVIYNISCMGLRFPFQKLLPEQECVHAFETRIDYNSNVERIKALLAYVHSVLKEKMIVNLTLDCTDNIFVNKKAIISNWNDLVSFIEDELQIPYMVDHNIPYCFFVGSNMKLHIKHSICSTNCAGLIAPDLSLRHCNQTISNLICIRQNGRFIPYKILKQYIYTEHIGRLHECLSKLCKDCMFWDVKCNGGCFVSKAHITRDSILQNTSLPLK